MLLGLGLQHKTVDDLCKQVDLPSMQLLGLFNKIIRKMVQALNAVLEKDVEKVMIEKQEINMNPTEISLEEDLVSCHCKCLVTFRNS